MASGFGPLARKADGGERGALTTTEWQEQGHNRSLSAESTPDRRVGSARRELRASSSAQQAPAFNEGGPSAAAAAAAAIVAPAADGAAPQQRAAAGEQGGANGQNGERHKKVDSSASSVGFADGGGGRQTLNLAALDALMAEAPKELVSCSSVEVVSEGGTIDGTADLCLHPVEHADALLSAQEAQGPRHGIRAFQDASKGGRRHVLMLPVNALVKGLNQVSMNDPLLEGWMGVSPAELARYMLWSGYDTLLLQQVPVMQATSGLGRWKMLETFTEAFARAWEEEAELLQADSQRSAEQNMKGRAGNGPLTPGSRGSRDSGGSRDLSEDAAFQFGTQAVSRSPTVPRSPPRAASNRLIHQFLPSRFRDTGVDVSETDLPRRRETTTTVNPMMNVFKALAGVAVGGADMDSRTRGHPGFWPPYIRVHTANVLVENGDAFVHHAFMSRDVDHPWWFSIKGIVMRNRHLDVKGLFSHSYASEVYKSRTQVVTFIENYVEDENADDLESMIKTNKSLWGLSRDASKDLGRGRRLSMFAIEEVDASVNIDPIDPPAAFRRVAVGEEFTEADALLPRPFSSVDIGHFLTVMQTKSIPALVCFSLPPALRDVKVFREKQEPISMVQYLSHPVFAEYEPNMPRVASAPGLDQSRKSIVRSASAVSPSARSKGVRWADQVVSKQEEKKVLDALECPNLEAFLDEVTNHRKRTGAVEWSAEGQEEADWIEAVLEQLRTAKKTASGIAKARSALTKNKAAAAAQRGGGDGGFADRNVEEVEEALKKLREVPEWVTQQLPDLLRLLEACRLLSNDPILLQSMVDAGHRVAKRRKGDTTPGATPSRSQANTPVRSRPNTPIRSRQNTPNTGGMRTPGGREIENEDDELLRTYEEEALPLHWADVEKLGKSDTLHDTDDGPELLEDQLLSAYLEYSVGQPRLGTRSSSRAEAIVLNNAQFLVDSGSLTPMHFETARCGPVKSDLFKSILAKFSALAMMLQSPRKTTRDSGSTDTKELKDIKAAVHAVSCWVSVSQVYACMSALASGGGAGTPNAQAREAGPSTIKVYDVERQVLTFTGAAESEEHYAFHSVYKKTSEGLVVYVTKEHKNQAAGVLWCYLKAMGVPVMICHLAECLMDRALDCRWDNSPASAELFKCAALKEGVVRLGYIGNLRPLTFISETCQDDIETMPILERACLLRMLAHGHGCVAEYSSAGPSKAKSRSELAASFRIISTWRMALVHNLRSMESSRYLNKFEDHLRLPRLTIVGTVIGHRGVDPRRLLWWTWMSVPWSPSARVAVTNLLTVIARAPPPRVSAAQAADSTPLSRSLKRRAARGADFTPVGAAALAGQASHGALWKMISELLVTRLSTCMLVRSLVLENRDESPYPPFEKHYHMVALELRGADKTAVFDFLRTDAGMLGEVLNRLVREDCLAADHSAAFLNSKSLGTLHNVKHGKSDHLPTWLETGFGGRLTRLRDTLLGPKDSPVLHGYSVGMYYSMPVLIELLLQITSGSSSSIYTNSALGTGKLNYESVVPMALLHSLVVFGGLSLGAAKMSSVNFFSFMIIKLVLAQTQFVAVLIVASVVLLPFITGAALLLWWDTPALAATFIGVFFFVGTYIMLVSLMLSTTGGKPWSSNSGRCLLLAHGVLLISPVLSELGIIPEEWGAQSFMAGVGLLLFILAAGFTMNVRRLYKMTGNKQRLTLTEDEWKEWMEEHKDHTDPTSLFYERASSMFTAWRHRLTRKRRYRMLDEDLEQLLLGFDAIRSAQAVPKRWSAEWDKRLKRGHEALVTVNRGAGVETASSMWAIVKWDVFYGASYFLMVFSDNLVSIWTDKRIVDADKVNMLALALFIVATAGLESMMMLNLGRANGWRFWRMDPEVLSMSDASKSIGNALHRLYLWDFATYSCFVMLCTLGAWSLGYFWIIADYEWTLYDALRATSLVVGYLGILVGLFHKILFGGSISRQKAAVKVSTAALIMGYGLGLGLVAFNRYLHFSDEPLSFATIGFTGFFYGFFSMYIYGEFRVQLNSQGFASGQLLSTPSLGTAGQRCLGVPTLHLDGMEARAVESCRAASGGRILTQQENRELIRRTLFGNGMDPSGLWTKAPRCLRTAFGNKVPRNDDFYRWTISPVPDRCILDHGLNALVDPEQDEVLYVAESVYADRQSFMECLMHETYEWAYGSHQVGVLAELLRDPLPMRMRRQIAGEETRLPTLVDRTLPCTVDVISIGCLKNEMFWRDLSPHSRELVLRMVLTQSPTYFRHVEDEDTESNYMKFAIDEQPQAAAAAAAVAAQSPSRQWPAPPGQGGALDPQSDLALAMRLGCRTGHVLIAAMEEASLGFEPHLVVARAALLSGLSQCVMRYALVHIASNSTSSNSGAPAVGLEQFASVGHLAGRQRVWGAMANANIIRGGGGKTYGRLSNVEALLGEVQTVFPPRGAFHLDYMLFGAASGCMGFDREAFALMLDQNPRSLPIFIKMHRASHWLYKKLLHHIVLKTDTLISNLMKTIKAIDVEALDGFVGIEENESGDAARVQGGSSAADDPESGNWLVEQRRSLERMIRDQDLPIAFSQWIDQMLLRREPLLADYWDARDAGNFSEALVSLKLVESDLSVPLLTGIPAGLSSYQDLATFAKCGSTIGMMRAPRDPEGSSAAERRLGGGRDVPEGTSTQPSKIKADGGVCVIAMDSGTWPLYGGGVSVCRKQLLDDTVGRVRWNTLFEVALPAPLPNTVEIPENIRQVLPIPLWSQNAGGSYETFMAHTSFITRALRESRTTNAAINAFFVPQLKTLIDLANTPGESVSVGGLEVAATAIAEIYAYFQVFDWETTWKAGTTHDHWAASWLACAARDKQAGPLLNSERPNLAELHEILNYWQTLLTCFQVQLPEMNAVNRGVIHVSHHGTQALVGIAAKRLSGWGLVVWDHGMLWRERCKAIAELHSSSLFVRKSLISLHRLVAKVTLYEADTLTPCTQMNKPWEMRVVSERDSEVREVVSRKVNPVLNGAPASIMPNDFLPGFNADNKNEWVTVVMLSHVYALKGVLTAIQAADLIVHRYGMKRFRLLIYGSTTHDVVYCRRCQDAIERLKLTENVWLKGKGRPAAVLAQGDMFLNSSVSEGLPLAIIEASRAGLVVVATDVGGTRDVVGEFGGICMPNSPLPLAKTMLETLAACKKWCKIAGAPDLDWRDIDLSPNPAQVLEKAIFNEDVINARHDWGTRYLEWTSKAFTLDRYRDEHVRALWYADRQAMANCARLTLDWGADPGQRRLAVSYLRLRRLLEVSDRKEHTNLSFISNFSEVRARIKSEQRSRTPIEISTDPTQLAQMSSFQCATAELPLLQWLHGGKTNFSDWGSYTEGSEDGSSVLSLGTASNQSSSVSWGGGLQRIEESDLEQSETPAATGGAGVVSIQTYKRSESSTSAEDSELDHSGSDRRWGRVGPSVSFSDDPPQAEEAHTPRSAAAAAAPRAKGMSLAERVQGGNSPGVMPRRMRRDVTPAATAADTRAQSSTSPAATSPGPRDGNNTAAKAKSSNASSPSAAGSDDEVEIRQKLERLKRFEELDRRLMERVGVHLADVGDLSSPTLARIVAPSPAAAEAAAAGSPSYLDGTPLSEADSLAMSLESIIKDYSSPTAVAAAAAAAARGGGSTPFLSIGSSAGQQDDDDGALSAAGRHIAPTTEAAAAARAAAAGPPSTPFLSIGSSTGQGDDDGALSAAGSHVPPTTEAAAAGAGAVEAGPPSKPFLSIGSSAGQYDDDGALSAAGSGSSSTKGGGGVSPVSVAAGAGRPSTGVHVSASGGGGGGGGSGNGGAPAAVEFSSWRGWVSSPILASGAGGAGTLKQDRGGGSSSSAAPWGRSSSGVGNGDSGGGGGGGGTEYRPGDGLDGGNDDGGGGDGAEYRPGDGLEYSDDEDEEDGVEEEKFQAKDGVARSDEVGRTTATARGGKNGGGGVRWEDPEPEPPRRQLRQDEYSSFDENAFAQRERRMRQNHLQRLGSAEPQQRGDARQDHASSEPRDKNVIISGASLLNPSNDRHRRSRSRAASRGGASGTLVFAGDEDQEMQQQQQQQQGRGGQFQAPRLSMMENVMHPREGAAPPPAPVPTEIWKERAQSRGNLVKAMVASQHLSSSSGTGLRGASPRSNTTYAGNNYHNTSGMAGAGSTARGRGTTGIVPPETEVPLPYAEDVLALQGAAERGIKKFEVAPLSVSGQQPPRAQTARRAVVQAADNFAAEDSADEDSDETGSIISAISAGSFQPRR